MGKKKLVRGGEARGWGKTNLFGASKLVDGEKQTCSGRRSSWMGKNKLVRGVEAHGWGKTNLFGASKLMDGPFPREISHFPEGFHFPRRGMSSLAAPANRV